MDTFAQRVQQWQVFYATLAASCATLTGLLFVALSLNVDILSRDENAELMRLAQKTFGDFLLVLMASLVFLVPGLPPGGLAVALSVLGASWTVNAVRLLIVTLRHRQGQPRMRHVLQRFGLSLLGGLGLIAVAITMLFGSTAALYGLVGVLGVLLASASGTAWLLLTRVRGRPTDEGS